MLSSKSIAEIAEHCNHNIMSSSSVIEIVDSDSEEEQEVPDVSATK